jgi:hypothetical protein
VLAADGYPLARAGQRRGTLRDVPQKTPPPKAKGKPQTSAAKSSAPVTATSVKGGPAGKTAAAASVAKTTDASDVTKETVAKAAVPKSAVAKESADDSRSEALARPASVTAAVVLTATIAAAMTGYAVYLIIGGLVGQPVLRGRAETVGVIFLIFGLGIGWVCRGLAKLQPWSRTPALLTHLLLVGSAYRIMQDSQYLEAALVGLYGLAGVVLLFVPASHKVLSRDVR